MTDLAVADLAMHDLAACPSGPSQGPQTHTLILTVLEGSPLIRSITDFRNMPFTEFASLYAVCNPGTTS